MSPLFKNGVTARYGAHLVSSQYGAAAMLTATPLSINVAFSRA
jgi:hypothetical protein